RGAFMIYGKRNYLRKVKLGIALVVERSGAEVTLRVVPSAKAEAYEDRIVLVPGRIKKSTLIRTVLRYMKKLSKERSLKLFTTADQLHRDLPTGGFHVLECRGIFGGLRIDE
ncbi:MAG: hypothetical protein DRN53_00595, partial [Thermoprotei archaeon]